MAILKCKMCGGDLEINEGVFVATCEYCGTKQTVPNVDDEKKITLFTRANRLRLACEFDKAYGIYESLVTDFENEAEAYWGLVLCRYGIEYVDDPKTGKKIPTCHRSSFESVLDDHNYKQTIANANVVAKTLYEEEAEKLEEIRKGIIEISSKEEPFDIFICYKESAKDGNRTVDSVIAQDVYKALTKEGYRVFFSRITLEDKLGVKYEPYIFSALHSAKVMLAFGTSLQNYEAVWVKNEWSRYLKLIENGESKTLIPCYRDMDPYDFPAEFVGLQAQDMGKVGAIQDLLHGIEKIITKEKPKTTLRTEEDVNGNIVEPLVKRAYAFLQSGEFKKAGEYCEKVLDLSPENHDALLGTILVELSLNYASALEQGTAFFHNTRAYKNIKSILKDVTYYENLLNKIKENNINRMESELSKKNFDSVRKFANNILSFDKACEKAYMGLFLADLGASYLGEAKAKLEKSFCALPSYKSLIAYASETTKKVLNDTIYARAQNLEKHIVEALKNKQFGGITKYAEMYLTYDGKSEKPYLYLFLAANSVSNLDELRQKLVVFTNDKRYYDLVSHATKETKEKLEDIVQEINAKIERKRLENIALYEKQMKEALAKRDFEKACDAVNACLSLDPGNRTALEVGYLASEGYTTIEALANLDEKQVERLKWRSLDIYRACPSDIKAKIDASIEQSKKRAKKKKTIRKAIIAVVVLAIVAVLILAVAIYMHTDAYIYGAKDDGNGGVIITDYRGSGGEVVIPNEIGGKPVVAIETYAFDKCDSLTSIILGNGVTTVGEDAFRDCTNLTSIVIPNSVITIEERAFYGCNSLKSIVIPKSVTTIGEYAFGWCSNLTICCEVDSQPSGWSNYWNYSDCPVIWGTLIGGITEQGFKWKQDLNGNIVITDYTGYSNSIEIPSEINGKPVTIIGERAFFGKNSIKTVSIPETVIEIESLAFYGCDRIETIRIPDSVKTIGKQSIAYCNNLQSIVVGKGTTLIDDGAFYFNEKLTSITVSEENEMYKSVEGNLYTKDGTTIVQYALGKNDTTFVVPDFVTSIGSSAFAYCDNLTSVVFGNNVTEIGRSAFLGSSILTLEIPESIEVIGAHAFAGANSLTEITIPSNVKNIGEGVFHGCQKLTSITVSEENEMYKSVEGNLYTKDGTILIQYAAGKSNLTFNVPEGVTTIGAYSLDNCQNIKYLTTPESVTAIGNFAFSNNYGLSSIVIPSSVTTIGEYAFVNCEYLKIYCKAERQPSGWAYNWNSSNRPVEWDYTGE